MYQTENTERIGCLDMLAAVKGIMKGNTVVVEDDMTEYDGAEVIVTILDYPNRKETSGVMKKNALDMENALQSLSGAVPYTDMSLSELREERLKKYEDIN